MSYEPEETLNDPLANDDLASLFGEPEPQTTAAGTHEPESHDEDALPQDEHAAGEDDAVSVEGEEPDAVDASRDDEPASPDNEMLALMRDMKGLIEGVVGDLSQLSGRVERLEKREDAVMALPAAQAAAEHRAIEQEADAIVAELEEIEGRIAQIVAELEELQARIAAVRAEIEGAETSHADALRAVDDARLLAETLPSAAVFAADAEAHAAQLLQRINQQRARLDEDEQRVDELEEERSSLEERARELRGEEPSNREPAFGYPLATEPTGAGTETEDAVELPSFEAAAASELPSFEPQPAAPVDELPAFAPVSEAEPELPAFESLSDLDPAPAPAGDELPSFGDELPSFESLSDLDPAPAPAGDELPSFAPVAEELPSFAPVAEELPAFDPVAEELPSFEPVAETDPLAGLAFDAPESLHELSADDAPAWEMPEPTAPAFGGEVETDDLDFGSRDIVAPLIEDEDEAAELDFAIPASAPAPGDDLPEPVDLLWKIAAVDPARNEAREEQETLSGLKTAASTSASAQPKKRKKGDKPQFEPLPFDVIAKTKPLIVTFFSPSGGVGKSSQAANFAAYVATVAQAQAFEEQLKTGKQDAYVPRVLLLDGDLVHGSLLARLAKNLSPEPNIQTLLDYVLGRGEANFQGSDRWPRAFENAAPGERAMTEFVHWPEEVPNLHVLAAPDDPYDFFKLYPEDYDEILQLLSQHYDVIVIDSGTEIVMPQTRAWLTHAHVVFALVAPLIDRIHNARKVMKLITSHYADPMDTNEQPRMLEPMIKRDSMGVTLIGADLTRGLGEPDELLEYAFGNTERNQRFKINDFREQMDNTINEGRFLVRESKDYAREIAALAKFAFDLYSPTANR